LLVASQSVALERAHARDLTRASVATAYWIGELDGIVADTSTLGDAIPISKYLLNLLAISPVGIRSPTGSLGPRRRDGARQQCQCDHDLSVSKADYEPATLIILEREMDGS
jgi:hypothetical protein